MNLRQTIFITEYLVCGNATQAAAKAEYSSKTAYSIGQRLLKNVEIQTEIGTRKAKIIKQTDFNITHLINEIRQIALAGSNEYVKLKAYDMLMKHFGGYVNEMQVIQKLSNEDLNSLFNRLLNKVE